MLGESDGHQCVRAARAFREPTEGDRLIGKPSGAFSTVTFNLTSQVVAAMQGQHSDFSLNTAVNGARAQQSFVLDNLHFTQ